VLNAPSHFLIGCKQDPDPAVRNLRISHPAGGGRHDDGNACFIVRTQQGGSTGRDDIIPDFFSKVRMLFHPDDLGRIVWQYDGFPIPGAMQNRFDAGSAAIRRRIHVRAETDRRQGIRNIGWNRCIDISVCVQFSICHTHGLQLLHQQPGKVLLLFRGGKTFAVGIALRVNADIAHQSLCHTKGVHHNWLF